MPTCRIYSALAAVTLLTVTPTDSYAPLNPPPLSSHYLPLQFQSDPNIQNSKLLRVPPPQSPIPLDYNYNEDGHDDTESDMDVNSALLATFSATSATTSLPDGTRKKKMQRPVFESALKQKRTRTNNRSSSPDLWSSQQQQQIQHHNHNNSQKSHALLTAAQEKEFAFRIRTFRAAVKLRDSLVSFQDGSRVYIHPTESQWATACGTTVPDLRRLIEEGQAARGALVACNAGLVVQQAKRYFSSLKTATEADGGVGTILTVSDMIQEGNLGLMEAVERFEPEKGFRFSTYATYWVRQRIRKSISDSSRIIRLPAYVHDMLQKIRKAKVEMKAETGRESNLTELAHYMEISEDRLRSYTASSRNVVSLERPTAFSSGGSSSSSGKGGSSSSSGSSGDDRRTLYDTLASDGPTPEEDAVYDAMRRDLRAVMDTELAGVERQVLVHRFGLEDARQALTVTETAAALAISIDRVRNVEARALNKLRHPMRNYKLKEYVAHQQDNNQKDEIPTTNGSLKSGRRTTSTAAATQATKESLEETYARSPTETKSDVVWFF